jgi:deoxyhypusine synthase
MSIRHFMQTHYKHFNSKVCVEAAEGWERHIQKGGKMFLTLAGAMSTAELGISLAELIRGGFVHGICCTGANLEEDLYHLIAKSHYKRIPHWRSLSAEDEQQLYDKGLNRVTDTCIPEEEAIRKLQEPLVELWKEAEREGKSYFPYEFLYQLLQRKKLDHEYEGDPKNSWLIAAFEKEIPVFVPGWEDSTTGNIFVSQIIQGTLSSFHTVKGGLELMHFLANWYKEITQKSPLGFFQIGGGIAGDFPICVVPMIRQDLGETECPLWDYFCQIGDSTTSYGSYSGATPSEKITWGKISKETPTYMIESDATIVAPLIFSYLIEGKS